MPAGIYIHIPFCERKCPYCDFYSVAPVGELRERYISALINEAAAFPPLAADSLYFGGGTPSLLEPHDIARLIELARARFSLSVDAEITLECNPATADREKLRAYRDAGVNRLSVGVQSADGDILRAAGRPHTALEALATLDDARAAGFDNISADIMIGLPGETGAQLEKTVSAVCSRVEHVSAYILKIMSGTPYAERTPEALPDDDRAAALYELACEALEAGGFEQYEISNFAKEEHFESRHNKKYWALDEWIGLGAAAHSCLAGERWSFARDINGFIGKFGADDGFSPDTYRLLLDYEGALDGGDYIMLRLRTRAGLSLARLNELYNISFNKQQVDLIQALANGGLARFDGGVFSLTRQGFLLSNSIIERFI